MKKIIGTVTTGSLNEGFLMRVSQDVDLEQIKTGKFVSIVGAHHTFFSLVTDLSLEVAHPDILLYPPSAQEKLLARVLKQKDIYATALLKPMLMLGADDRPSPVKTVPPHFSLVHEADARDVARIFGDEKDPSKRYFNIGSPLDMNTPVCLDLDRLIERSNGIFGKTGTGKTFLTRLVLAGLIKNQKAVNLIFDMHSEYGLQARKEGKNLNFVKGLKTLFGSKVAIFSLDPESTRRRGMNPDVELVIDYRSIAVEDILSLESELKLHATALEAAYLVYAKYKEYWLEVLLSLGSSQPDGSVKDIKQFAQEIGANAESIAALYRKLKRIERLPFLKPGVSAHRRDSVIDQLMEYISQGKSVVIEFGNYTSTFVYLLIANIITRRIHAEYVERTERFLGTQKEEDRPKQLMITIEEAHKFLNPQAARQTIFGTIAREMRKYYVSLLVVDQRPSGIDEEILSQIGTKIVAQLNDEKDIAAVLTGMNNAGGLRSILATLDSKKQALLMGHALAMPVVIQTREYDEQFYRAMQDEVSAKNMQELISEIF